MGLVVMAIGQGKTAIPDSVTRVIRNASPDSQRLMTALLWAGKNDHFDRDHYEMVAKDLATFKESPTVQCLALMYKGMGFRRGQHIDSAVFYLLKAKEVSYRLAEPHNGLKGITGCNLGMAYYEQGRFEDVLKEWQASLPILERSPLTEIASLVRTNMPALYFASEQYELAIAATKERLQRDALISPETRVNEFFNIASSYSRLEEYRYSQDYLDSAKAFIKSTDLPPAYRKTELLVREAINAHALGDSALSAAYLDTILVREKQAPIINPEVKNMLGELLLRLRRYSQGLRHSQKLKAAMLHEQDLVSHPIVYELLAEFHQHLGNYDSSLYYTQKRYNFKDSLASAKAHNRVQELLIQYEAAEKDKRLLLMKNEANAKARKYQVTLLISIFSIVVLALIGAVFYQRYKSQKQKAEREQLNMQLQLDNQQLKQEQLTHDLAHKRKLLTTEAIKVSQQNALMGKTLQDIDELYTLLKDDKALAKIRSVKQYLKRGLDNEQFWDDFRKAIGESHPGFLERLEELSVDLNNREMRLLYLAKLGLNLHECGKILQIAPKSVKMARYRLKQKLQLAENVSLDDFVANL